MLEDASRLWPPIALDRRHTTPIAMQASGARIRRPRRPSGRRRSAGRRLHRCGPLSAMVLSLHSQQIAKRDLERLVGRRHVVADERRPASPKASSCPSCAATRAPPSRAEIDRHQQMEIGISVARKGERREIDLGDLDAKLLLELADQRFLRLLLPARPCRRETPKARRETVPAGAWRSARRAPHSTQRAGRDDHDRARLTLTHVRTRRLTNVGEDPGQDR